MLRKLLVLFMLVSFIGTAQVSFASGQGYKIKRLVSQLYKKRTFMDAKRSLTTYGPEVTDYVLPLLMDQNNERIRIAALDIITAVKDSSAEDDVVNMLNDKNARVRQAAARSLSVIGRKTSSIAPLKKLLTDYNPNVRYNAVKALARFSPADEEDLFISTLGDYDPRVRMYGIIALGKLKSTKAVPYVAQLTKDVDPNVRFEVANTLGLIGTKETIEPLVWLLSDPEIRVRLMAIDKLSIINMAGTERPLMLASDNSDPRVASKAIFALASMGSSKAIIVARNNLNDEYMTVKIAAISVVGQKGNSEDIEALESLLKAESTLVRKEAYKALASVKKRT